MNGYGARSRVLASTRRTGLAAAFAHAAEVRTVRAGHAVVDNVDFNTATAPFGDECAGGATVAALTAAVFTADNVGHFVYSYLNRVGNLL